MHIGTQGLCDYEALGSTKVKRTRRERERECVRERERERVSVRERERERETVRERYEYSYLIRVQRTSVARVAVFPHNWAILKIQSREKLQSRGLRFLGYFYNVPRPPKVYVYVYTHVIAKGSYYKYSLVV